MTLSIVVPALNEEAALPATLAAARRACPDAEMVVVDGGSTDATRTVAEDSGAVVLSSLRGRGRQQNAGAGRARGDILLFLHADTLLPEGAGAAVAAALEEPSVIGGNFRLEYDSAALADRLFASAYNLRSRWTRHYYGDSCLFVQRSAWKELGGFREATLMEDWVFVQELERRCRASRGRERTVLLTLSVKTSARRFRGRRLRYLLLWARLHYLHARGVSGDALAALYPNER